MKEVALGIDIGGTNCLIGLVDEFGNILHETNLSTKSIPDADNFFKLLAQELEKTADNYTIIGAGIGAPNANYYTKTIDHAPNLNWGDSIPFGEMFSKYFDYPLVLTNDANAAAMGEKRFGGAKNMKDFIVITLGTGLGSGIVVDNKIVYGHSGMAGELGHINVNPKGRFCACGRRGCLETYLSATGIKRTVYKLLADYTEESILRDISYNNLTAKMITESAQEGDFIAIKAFEYTGKMLGQKLADTVLHTSPEAIFLFGGLVRAGEHLFKPTLKHMEKKMMDTFKGTVKVLPSELLDKNAAVLGAAALAWDEVK
jgi:glucokinase